MAEVRPLRADDREAWQPLWDGYCAFYREDILQEVTDKAFRRLTGEHEAMTGLLAVHHGEAVGFAHLIRHPSTWAVHDYLYLEDLYVAPSARGLGIGELLIEGVYEHADRTATAHVYWHTQEYNGAARSLYDKVGRRSSFVVYER